MKSDRDNHTGAREGDLLVILAKVNEHMMSIRKERGVKPHSGRGNEGLRYTAISGFDDGGGSALL
jgi:hypothetical protein